VGLAITDARLDGVAVGVRIEGGTIAAVGPAVVPEPGDEVLDAGGMVVAPGMVNAHTHAAMALFRSFGDDLPLMTWLQTRIWPAEGRLTADDVYWGTRLACLEMVRSGTTTFADMYWHPGEVARAADDAGLRALVACALVDGGEVAGAGDLRQAALASLDALAGASSRITPMLGPHAVYTVSEASLAWLGELAAERGVGVHVHLSETEGEVERCVAATGVRPPALLDRCGLLGPGTLAAHGCWLDPDELALLAERGATVVANPVSNMKLAVGRLLDVPAAAAAGVPLGLGTDGAASNNGLDLFQDVKLLALAAKFLADDPAVLPAGEALAVARGQRSALLGGRGVEVGAPADLLLLRTGDPEVVPGDHDANLTYAATGALVDTTIVDGRVLMRHRHVPGAEEVLAQVGERVRRLTAD
jgi:5-methylthioadenosine/S-adenosylhomocysteine deaminase